MAKFVIGHYYPGQSLVHRLDPRGKLIITFLFMLLIFFANDIFTYSLLFAYTFLAMVFSSVPVRFYFMMLKPIFWIIILTSLLHLWVTKGGAILLHLPFLTIYEEGVRQAVFLAFRLMLLVWTGSILTFTTSPIELTHALQQILQPLARFRLPVHEFAFMMSMALRFIPLLWEEAEKIKKAQMARGVRFEQGNLYKRIKHYIPILVPLLVSIFRRSEELAMAMEARCYRGGIGRTSLRQFQFTSLDLWYGLIFAGIAILFWLVRG
jgi:energy-coupling factor transport system permease protein